MQTQRSQWLDIISQLRDVLKAVNWQFKALVDALGRNIHVLISDDFVLSAALNVKGKVGRKELMWRVGLDLRSNKEVDGLPVAAGFKPNESRDTVFIDGVRTSFESSLAN